MEERSYMGEENVTISGAPGEPVKIRGHYHCYPSHYYDLARDPTKRLASENYWTWADGSVVDKEADVADVGVADVSAVVEIGSHTLNLHGHTHSNYYWGWAKDNTAGDGNIGKVTVFPADREGNYPEPCYPGPAWLAPGVVANIPLDKQADKQEKKTVSRRMVRVVVYDDDKRVPDHQAVVYQSGLFCSSLPENELLLEMAGEISEGLVRYNEVRTALLDEKESNSQGRDVFLRAVRLNDLEKTVISET